MRLLALAACTLPFSAAANTSWNVTRSDHFEVWSDAPIETALALDAGLERLHAFFVRQLGVSPAGPVRVICFASPREFAEYRISSGAAGYSLTGADGEYIVISTTVPDLRIAAHEYAHLLIHSSGWSLPEWLAEGISEVVSSVRFGERYSFIGGDLPGRSHQLKTEAWMTPDGFFSHSTKSRGSPRTEPLFYAQSWVLAELLIVSPGYAPRFPGFVAMLAKGSTTRAALEGVYHNTPEILFRDARERLARGPAPIPLPAITAAAEAHVEPVSTFDIRRALAGLRYAAGEFERAEDMYRALASERPGVPEISAALGMIALDRKQPDRAVLEWGRAIELGLRDAGLCYRYAVLADERGLDPATVRAAMERAVAIRPDFDEAHFRLALMDQNASRPAGALAHLRAMHPPAPGRAWRYYSALADSLLDLERRTEARDAAAQAERYASNDDERRRARSLAYLADTEITVEIAATPDGRREFRTVRVPVNAPPRNPFIEADDDAHSVEATLRDVNCAEQSIHLIVGVNGGELSLSVPDPSRVQIRNGGGVKFEFTCGPQKSRPVLVEYTAAHILRGLELK